MGPDLIAFAYALLAASILAIVATLLRAWYRRPGVFAGSWKGQYVSARAITIDEDLSLRSAFGFLWGTSRCRWRENDRDRSGVYRVLGLGMVNCLLGIYYPARPGEHDMGVFIALLEAGSSPTKASGLTTNFESDDGADAPAGSAGSGAAGPRTHNSPLVACRYTLSRP